MRVVVTQLIVFLFALSAGAEEENLELHFHLTPDDEGAPLKKDVDYGMDMTAVEIWNMAACKLPYQEKRRRCKAACKAKQDAGTMPKRCKKNMQCKNDRRGRSQLPNQFFPTANLPTTVPGTEKEMQSSLHGQTGRRHNAKKMQKTMRCKNDRRGRSQLPNNLNKNNNNYHNNNHYHNNNNNKNSEWWLEFLG